MTSDQLVAIHGEKYRCLIEDALFWLEGNQLRWGLEEPINIEEFILDLVQRAKLSRSEEGKHD